MSNVLQRCWARVDLDRLHQNMAAIRSRLHPKCQVMAVVKANAYGHGDGPVIRALQKMGADWFAVSNIEEAVALRKEGALLPILILGYTPVSYAGMLDRFNLTQAVFSQEYAAALAIAANDEQAQVQVHIKVDTGMSRIGFFAAEDSEAAADSMRKVYQTAGLRCTGIFTHFACSDETDAAARIFTKQQFERFSGLCRALQGRGIETGLRHCCNSGATIQYPQMQMDMVRPGIILYGLEPSQSLAGKLDLQPVLELYATVAMVKRIPQGSAVSYGRTFVAPRETTVATVTCGYADGYPRSLSGRAQILVRGQRVPVIGRVCMDQLMIDVTDVPGVQAGDTATIVGSQESDCITFEELAHLAGTINYELVCNINRRVPRLYSREGEVIDTVDYLLAPMEQ